MFLFFKHNVNFVLKNVNMADLNVELVKQLSDNIDKLHDQYLGLKQEIKLLQGEKGASFETIGRGRPIVC